MEMRSILLHTGDSFTVGSSGLAGRVQSQTDPELTLPDHVDNSVVCRRWTDQLVHRDATCRWSRTTHVAEISQ